MPSKIENARIKIHEIIIENRIRKDLGDVDSLADDITLTGWVSPILVDQNYRLLAGQRRIEALKRLDQKEADVQIIHEPTEVQRTAIELLENLGRKGMTWQEEVTGKKTLDEAMRHERGTVKRGERTDIKDKKTSLENKEVEKWSLRKTAELLGESLSLISQDIGLATDLEKDPENYEGVNKKSKAKAIYKQKTKRMRKQRQIDPEKTAERALKKIISRLNEIVNIYEDDLREDLSKVSHRKEYIKQIRSLSQQLYSQLESLLNPSRK